MNRQTIVVTVGTVALLCVGGFLLYSTPQPGDAKPKPEAVAKAAKATKTPAEGAQKVPPGKLIHTLAIPEDRPAAPEGAPNVVLVMLSTVRKDQTSLYGGPADTTPFLASKAAEGVSFTDALANGVWPKPAQVALLTGRYPHELGMVETLPIRDSKRLAAEHTLLSERFAAAGWTTVGATASHYLNGKFGMRQGFDWYRESQPFGYTLETRIPGKAVVDAAMKGVDAQKTAAPTRPLYVQLAFVDSHKPFKVPPEEFAPFEGTGAEVAPYRATLRRQDKAVEHLVAELAKRGLTAENTVFIVVGEHGEGLDLPEHHRKQHGRNLYHSSVEVPWLMWGKSVGVGKKVDGLVSQVDLAPTLLGLVGLPKDGVAGIDLSVLVQQGGTSERPMHYADTFFEKMKRGSVWTADRQCQKDFGSEETEPDPTFVSACYDRRADVNFTAPIEAPELAAQLDAEFAARLASMPAAPPPAAPAAAEE